MVATMTNEVDLDKIFAQMDAAADRAEKALDGRFGQIYRELRALSPEEVDEITPGVTDQKEYERLIELVQEATEQNLSQAQLVERINELSDVAKKIAKKVHSIAGYIV